MSLRIAWLGPWNSHSTIAHFGALVTGELRAREHAVDIYRTETGKARSLPQLPAPAGLGWLTETTARELHRRHDVLLANLGNNFGYHGALLPEIAGLGAVLILHDFFLGHLALEWSEVVPGIEPVLRRMMETAYGPDACSMGEPFWIGEAPMARRRPMLEPFAAAGIAAIVHARHYEERTRAACAGPVACLPLAYDCRPAPPPGAIEEPPTLVTIGHLNPNRRVDEIIRALARSPRLRRCRLRIVGPCLESDRRGLLALAERLGVVPPWFTGWVEETELLRHRDEADILFCLRSPVLEGASGSVIMAMLSARPTLVSDHGCYAEIPDDCVYKCRAGQEAADIARHLNAILDDPDTARQVGLRAAAYARRQHDPAAYVDGLLPLIDAAIAAAPALRAGLGLGRILAELGAAPDDAATQRIGTVLARLLGAGRSVA
jgi:glycosyltransferase involved in cell wall biosynthesis